ncbi:MAG: hypothetical protein M0Z75_10905 [Nitrospiraceae bacterium]|nr:hypothetical protein [Nitrospiraceae bacterium]
MESWYALYLKPRCETPVAVRLESAGIETLNPLLKQKKLREGRVMESIEPLFPCYIFARFDPLLYYHMITYTRGVRHIVGAAVPLEVPGEIIGGIKDRMAGGLISLPPRSLEPGIRVVIKDGSFEGFYGIFERYTKGRERCLILLEALGWALETEAWMVGGAG